MRTVVVVTIFVICAVLTTTSTGSDNPSRELSFELASSLPPWISDRKQALAGEYKFANWMNPFYLNGDFDGDGKLDVAILVTNEHTAKRGVAVFFAKGGVHVLGAGVDFGHGGDDFYWLGAWFVFTQKGLVKNAYGGETKITNDGFVLIKLEAASAVIHWDGTSFKWFQLGD